MVSKAQVYVDVDISSFKITESPIEYHVSNDLPPMPLDYAFDIYINGAYIATLVMSPSWVEEAILGFIVGESIARLEDVRSIIVSRESKAVNIEAIEFRERRRFYFDDCVALAAQASKVKSKLKVSYKVLEKLYQEFDVRSSGKQGVQATGVYDLSSGRTVIAYDVSRYTSIVKAIGFAMRNKFKMGDSVTVTTGRASGDLMVLIANSGIPIVITSKNPIYSGYMAAVTYKVTLAIAMKKGKGDKGVELRALTYPERFT